jgi:uncharacterized membrane protein
MSGDAQVIAPPPPARLESLDLLRGLVMVVMALDHTRDYFHGASLAGLDPTDLARTTPWIFFTRFITHYCAPVFSFLAGAGVFLAGRKKTKRELSWFLVTRGLWLVLLELTFVKWAWTFEYDLHRFWGIVLWALGWSMVVLAGLIHLPFRVVAAIGLVLVFGHNALDGIQPADWGSWGWLWQLLHVRGPVELAPGYTFRAGYSLLPWIGIMTSGYAFGALYQMEAGRRRRWLVGLGLGALALFAVLRGGNLYGDLRPWTPQPRTGFTFLSILNCTKYPPSLSYGLITLGPALLLLAWLERGTPAWTRPLLVYGRVPFFYYMLHIPLIHGMAALLSEFRFGRSDYLQLASPLPAPPGAGYSLPWVYLAWLVAVVSLYPLCRWFAALKQRRRDLAWLSYF